MALILILDDEPRYAEPARRALEMVGHRVVVKASVRAARSYLAAHQEVAAIILDLNFPVRHAGSDHQLAPLGKDYLVELRDAPETRETPIVIYTVYMDDQMRDACLAAGATAYVEKMSGGFEILEVLAEHGVAPPPVGGGRQRFALAPG